jgi:putative cell wall-binding protein
LRRAGRLVAAVLTTVALATLGATATATGAAASVTAGTEVEIARLVNELRAQHGLPALRTDVRLVADARAWSGRMAASGTLAHDPEAGNQMPAGTRAWAENVGWTSATGDLGARLHDLFANSAPHRANLLDARYTDIGIGIGAGGGRTYVTQRFTTGAPARVATAVEPTAALAEQHFGGGRAAHVVIARDDVYADALAAGPLAGRTGPIVLTPPGPVLHPVVRLALDRSLPRGGTVWIAGGTAAVSSGVQAEVAQAGWQVKRLAGKNRFETAAQVADAIARRDGRPDEVLIATGAGWADAAAGGAYGARTGAPVLLALKNSVPPETSAALAALRPPRVAALGGTAVLSDRTLARLGAARVAGATRQDTSALIARDLWGHAHDGPARWLGVPGFGDDAWTWALGAAPVAARQAAPVLLVGPELTSDVRDYLSSLGYGGGDTADLLTHGPVPAASAAEIRSLLR